MGLCRWRFELNFPQYVLVAGSWTLPRRADLCRLQTGSDVCHASQTVDTALGNHPTHDWLYGNECFCWNEPCLDQSKWRNGPYRFDGQSVYAPAVGQSV